MVTLSRTGLRRALAIGAVSWALGSGLTMPARAFDLHYRQNGTTFSAIQLRDLMRRALPVAYDQAFADQRWSTYVLLDAHPSKQLVAITMGLSPRVGQKQALLPVATYSVIEPLPQSVEQWNLLLTSVAAQYAQAMLANQGRIVAPTLR